MTLDWVHPGLLLILGAWILPFLRGRAKHTAMLVLPAAALYLCLRMTPGTYGKVSFLGQDLVFGRVDSLSLIFSYIFSIMAFLGMVVALHVEARPRAHRRTAPVRADNETAANRLAIAILLNRNTRGRARCHRHDLRATTHLRSSIGCRGQQGFLDSWVVEGERRRAVRRCRWQIPFLD